MNFAAAITLYNPTDDFIRNLLGYTKDFPLVIVNDNTHDNSRYIDLLKTIPNIVYFWEAINLGLPIPFNKSIEYCLKNNIDFLCTLDQDSKLSSDSISVLKDYIVNSDMSSVAIVAPNPIDINKHPNSISLENAKEVSWVICSGAFLNLKLLEASHIRYDEAYFIDRFDADICKQIHESGLKQIILTDVEMPHACGDEFGHSILRTYYIFRNRFYYNDKYYSNIWSKIRTLLQIVRQCYYLLTKQKDSIKKIRMLPIAFNDYYKGKMGIVSNDTLSKINKISR